MVFDTIFVCHFVDTNTGVEIALKKKEQENYRG